MVVPLPSKQEAGVRFPLSALQPIEPLYLKDNEQPNYTLFIGQWNCKKEK